MARAPILGCAVSIAGCLVAGPGLAQQPDAIDEVVVTAHKIDTNANSIAESVNAISGADLIQTGVANPSDLVKDVPGFQYTRSAYGQPVYTVRGVGFYDTSFASAPAVSMYLDEVPLPYSAMAAGAAFDLDQVQVLKGPQGTLFGENSTAGAVNFIAAKPTRTFEAGFDVSGTNFGESVDQGYVSGPLTDTLAARASVMVDEGGAWQKSYTRPDDDLGTKQFEAMRIQLDYHPTDALSVNFNLNGWLDHSDTQAGQFIKVITAAHPAALTAAAAGYPQPPPNARYADWDPNLPFRNNNHFYQGSLRIDYKLDNDLTITSLTSYDSLDVDTLVDTDGMNIQSFNVHQGGYVHTVNEELRLAGSSLEHRWRWLVGGNYEHDVISQFADPFSAISSFPYVSSLANGFTTSSSPSVFANSTFDLLDSLSLETGIRYTRVNLDNQGCTYDNGDGVHSLVSEGIAKSHGVIVDIPRGACLTLNSTTFLPGVVKDQLDQSNVPWKVGLNWKVYPGGLLYANVSRGYKAGDFSVSGATYATSLRPALQESVLAYEAGFKLALLNDALQLNGAGFYYNYNDKQVRGKFNDPVVGSQNTLVNVPHSRVEGAELEMVWKPFEGLHFDLSGTYTDAVITGSFIQPNALGAVQQLGDTALPFAPRFQAAADGEYEFPLVSELHGFVGAHLSYQSDSNAGLGNVPIFTIDSYTNVDVRLGVRGADGKWYASLFVNNVADRYSWNAVSLSGPDNIVRLANMPREFGIRAGYKFK
jgi:iron complex outermembrane recepter protein